MMMMIIKLSLVCCLVHLYVGGSAVALAPIAAVPPFNSLTDDSYDTFIENVRVALAGPGPAATVVDPVSKAAHPVLAKETGVDKQPPRWIHVELHGKNGVAPKVAIRSDNAYIIGFTNSQGKWFQLSKTGSEDKLVGDNPAMAGFDGNYNTLVGGFENLPTLNLNKFGMAKAAASLWNKKGSTSLDVDGDQEQLRAQDPVKEAVATVAVAVCEAARFVAVSDIVKQGWTEQRASVTTKEAKYIKNWGDLSSALLDWKKKDYKEDETFFGKFKDIGISDGEQALAVVRLVKDMASATGLRAEIGVGEFH